MTTAIREADCVELLRWALPQLGLRWDAVRRNKRQVCRRVRARVRALGLSSPQAYAEQLDRHPEEWSVLEAMCGITISRFYRDRPVFDRLAGDVLPVLARELGPDQPLRVWSAGCASGEEPYSIALIWELELSARERGRALEVLATDRDPRLLARAAIGCYRRSSLRELPPRWIERAFTQTGELWCLDPRLRRNVTFDCQNLRNTAPPGRFDVILCRNVAFSYFDVAEQRAVLGRLTEHLAAHGHLVLGLDEELPEPAGFQRLPGAESIWRRSEPV